ncbi:MAG: 2Fe-2S iron-sulfur cluster binding domain-containing protein [Spirochaetaceae bacterium]|jgi:carbon-monoxide dehydrogenase small subunit|nr:2Fe-2S iron-sulfur cluster binding domain-containing protein [Spirochaetaceae bacterium]GMO22193.1 MAG: 2Fe-2S iron-sulfur cluster-binding protein [Termitinemataceae bacterium]
MTVNFLLNNKKVTAEAEPNERLIDLLRGKFGLTGAKSGCHSGQCGACAVFFNDVITPSCLVPAFNLNGANVITIEGFSETAEYKDIIAAFTGAGVENCGYCNAGKILLAESLLRSKQSLCKEIIVQAYDGTKCRCTDAQTIVRAVLAAEEIRNRRLNAE